MCNLYFYSLDLMSGEKGPLYTFKLSVSEHYDELVDQCSLFSRLFQVLTLLCTI